jgi:hypothetical protein
MDCNKAWNLVRDQAIGEERRFLPLYLLVELRMKEPLTNLPNAFEHELLAHLSRAAS